MQSVQVCKHCSRPTRTCQLRGGGTSSCGRLETEMAVGWGRKERRDRQRESERKRAVKKEKGGMGGEKSRNIIAQCRLLFGLLLWYPRRCLQRECVCVGGRSGRPNPGCGPIDRWTGREQAGGRPCPSPPSTRTRSAPTPGQPAVPAAMPVHQLGTVHC